MAEVTLENVRKVFPNGVEAVKGFDLSIADGEFVVLVGPSGCGKSTTLRMVAGLEEITGGTIEIDGRVVNDVHPKDRDIAMVFQNYALYPHMSVRKNMAFALKLRKVPKAAIEERVNRTADMLGIRELLDRKPKQLSGGQRQRVAVGRAIVREPKAFLFDEPLSNLDAKLRVTTRAELKSLHQRLRTTTIYVTHDQEEAMTLGDRVVVMSEGTIQQTETPLGVYDRPVNRFVASFIGTPPMNFLDGTLAREGSDLWFIEKGEANRLRLAPNDELNGSVGTEVVLGMRPQAMREVESTPEGAAINLTVDVIEPLGDRMDVACHTSSHSIIARIEARMGLETGKPATFAVDTGALHVFEPGEYGANLTIRQAAAV